MFCSCSLWISSFELMLFGWSPLKATFVRKYFSKFRHFSSFRRGVSRYSCVHFFLQHHKLIQIETWLGYHTTNFRQPRMLDNNEDLVTLPLKESSFWLFVLLVSGCFPMHSLMLDFLNLFVQRSMSYSLEENLFTSLQKISEFKFTLFMKSL